MEIYEMILIDLNTKDKLSVQVEVDEAETTENIVMEQLKQYCIDICCIDNLQTFIISPLKYDDILKDNELLKCMKKSKEKIASFIKIAREVDIDRIYLAFVYLPAAVEKFQWLPIHCYKSENQFYHIHYRDSWMCRECGSIMHKSMIMPMVEAEPSIYHLRCEYKSPNIPSIFQKIKCPQCGKPLQNHLLIIK